MITTNHVGQKHVRSFEAKHLRSGETISHALTGYKGKMFGGGDDKQVNGVLLLTDSRVVFYRKGLLGEVLESMPLNRITSVEASSIMGTRRMTLHTSHDGLRFVGVEGAPMFDAMRAAIEDARDGGSPSAASPPAASVGDQMRSLTELHRDGIITDDEFAAKREALLGRL